MYSTCYHKVCVCKHRGMSCICNIRNEDDAGVMQMLKEMFLGCNCNDMCLSTASCRSPGNHSFFTEGKSTLSDLV